MRTSARSVCSSSTSANRTNASSPSSASFPSYPARATAAGCSPKPCTAPGARASTGCTSTPARSTIPAALAAYLRAGFAPSSARSSASPIRASRHPAEGLRPSDPAARHRRLSRRPPRQLGVNSQPGSPGIDRQKRVQHLADDGDQQAADRARARASSANTRTSRVVTDPTADDEAQRAITNSSRKREQPPPIAARQIPASAKDGDRPDILGARDRRRRHHPHRRGRSRRRSDASRPNDAATGGSLHSRRGKRTGPSR